MAFRNFVYAEDEEDLSFLPKEPSPGFSIGSSSTSVNIEPLKADEELMLQHAEVTTDSKGSSKPELFVVYPGSVVVRIKDRKCKTRGGSSRPHVKRKLASGSLNSRATYAMTSTSKDDVPFLILSDDDKGECDVIKERERAWEEEFESLRAKCKVSMSEFEKNPTASLLTLESQVASLEVEKVRLEAVEVSLRNEVDDVKRDRMEVVPKVVMKLVYNDDLGSLVGRLVSSAIFYGRCKALEQASNDLATVTFPWLLEFMADPLASAEVLLSKKPPSLQRHAPSKTQAIVASSQKATPSSIPASNPMSPPADAFIIKP
nr:hypothetical protein [Tanacetum cinerariifolium]